MKILNYIGLIVVLSTLGILFKRSQSKYDPDEELKRNDLVKKYLLNDNIIYGKPNLWIFVKKELNSRNWNSFGSRMNNDVNKPYIRVCIESIIKYNQDDFNIFIVNDNSFSNLLKDWNIIIDNIPDPIKGNVRRLGIAKLLYEYGGISVSRSFLCNKNLSKFYMNEVKGNNMFCVENVNKSTNQLKDEFLPDDKIIGCNKSNEKMGEYVKYIEKTIKEDNSNESKITGNFRYWLNEEAKKFNIKVVNGKMIGIKDKYDKLVSLEDLMGESIISFCNFTIGQYVEEDDLEKRTKYKWFNRLSKKQLFESNTVFGNLMLLSHGELKY